MESNNQQPNTTNTNNQATQPAAQPVQTQNNQPKPQQPQKQPAAPAKIITPANKKSLYISGALILVVLILLTLVPYAKNHMKSGSTAKDDTAAADTGCQPGFKFNIKTGEPCPAETADQAASATPVASTGKALSRADAQQKYANATLTVSGTCSIEPHELTVSKGATIMLDNNTAKAHTVTVGGKSYRISPYHYTLSWVNGTDDNLGVTCDGKSEGAAVTVK